MSETQQTSVAAEESVANTTVDAEDLSDRTPEDVEVPAADEEPDDDVEDDDEDESEDDEEDGADDAPGAGRSGRRRGGESLRRLEEEGEVAADYLEELLDIVDLDGDIDIDVENGRASVAIVAEAGGERELRRLVGAHGEVLEALQELSRLAVQARTGDRSRLMLDVAGFRAARRRTLEDVAARICQEVRRSGEPARLDPMSAFERKVVHDVVAGAGLVSESEGEEPNRRVVVHPAAS
ncbi:MAG TPA: R3H domain-containing nucleic acid-binding protein [Kineosporiaceae bacterium]|nr:R3H domain-containing nucleic acid-binding protein [Kineosporiaceae bacterium]